MITGKLRSVLSFQSDDAKLVMRLLREEGYRHRAGYATALLSMAVASACTALTAYLLGSVVNALYNDRNFNGVVLLSLSLVVLCSIKGIATYLNGIMLARLGNRIVAQTQTRIFDKLLQEGLHYFDERHSAQFLTSATHGAVAMTSVLNHLILALGRDLLSLAALVAVMIRQDPFLSFIGLLILPVTLLTVQNLVKRVRNVANTQYASEAAILQTMQESIQGMRVVKAFNLEDQLRQRMSHDVAMVERASNKMARISNRSAPLIEALGGVAIGAACMYGGYRVLLTGAAPGEFVGFMTAFLLAFDPARRLAKLNIDLTSNLVAVRILKEQLDTPPSEPDDSTKLALVCTQPEIAFNAVKFAYRRDLATLRDISFVAKPRLVTALVGPSGGGKSTIFNLLLRFYDVQGGQISIDGKNIDDFTRRSLRQQIAYVGQDIFLFRGTVRDNILLGRPDATPDDVITASKAAFAHDFISAFPKGYETQVGEFGSQLSLGQRQRIAVARALIKNASIVLLDEPTASLDSESEHHVQEAIRRLCVGKTTLVIAHRLNTIRDADCIHVIEGGTIVESGRHNELLGRHGRYTTFCRLQFPDEFKAQIEMSTAGDSPGRRPHP
jgi:ATP-binding cassette, subfamily B, bacterial MsbA